MKNAFDAFLESEPTAGLDSEYLAYQIWAYTKELKQRGMIDEPTHEMLVDTMTVLKELTEE